MASDTSKTAVGSYFIANYPPFSLWNPEHLGDVSGALQSAPHDVPLGLYIHIPFCRKRCKFCYFPVYTDKNAGQIETYLAALSREIELMSMLPCIGGRPFRFVYFGVIYPPEGSSYPFQVFDCSKHPGDAFMVLGTRFEFAWGIFRGWTNPIGGQLLEEFIPPTQYP